MGEALICVAEIDPASPASHRTKRIALIKSPDAHQSSASERRLQLIQNAVHLDILKT